MTNAENKKSILYISDRKKCNQGECPNPECFHTTDPSHRGKMRGCPTVFVEDDNGNQWEQPGLFSDMDEWARRKVESR